MSRASSEMRNLAERLLAFEAAHHSSTEAGANIAEQVIEELRLHLIRLAGVDGFQSLLSRALTLAKAEVPSLNMVKVRAAGSLEGFAEIEQSHDAGAARHAGIALVAHLLELLVTFIGAPLTLVLVRDKWPDASMAGAHLRTEEET